MIRRLRGFRATAATLALVAGALALLVTSAGARTTGKCGAGPDPDVGGSLYLIGNDAPAWSPDATKIAFTRFTECARGAGDIFVMDSNGKNVKQLTTSSENDDVASWSPDGTKILFLSDRDSPRGRGRTLEIYVMNADGSGQRRLTSAPGTKFPARFSPDGSKILFASNRDGAMSIYVMNADGTGLTRLTTPPFPSTDSWPAWSPDGKQIVFERLLVAPKLFVMNADGSNTRRVTKAAVHLDESRPSWSPDGTRILFRSYLRKPPAGNADIYVVTVETGAERRLTTYPGWEDWPQWSPDGKRVAFSRGPSTFYPEVFVMSAEGKAARALTRSKEVPKHRLAFVRFTTLPKAPRAGRLFTVRLDIDEVQDVVFGKVVVTCRARVAGKILRPTRRSFLRAGRATCSWKIPSSAKGKRLTGFIKAQSDRSDVPEPFSYRIR